MAPFPPYDADAHKPQVPTSLGKKRRIGYHRALDPYCLSAIVDEMTRIQPFHIPALPSVTQPIPQPDIEFHGHSDSPQRLVRGKWDDEVSWIGTRLCRLWRQILPQVHGRFTPPVGCGLIAALPGACWLSKCVAREVVAVP